MDSGRSWRRRRRRIDGLPRTLIGAIVVSWFALAAHAQTQTGETSGVGERSVGQSPAVARVERDVSSDADAGAALLDEFLSTVDTLEANFEQHITDVDGRPVESGAGKLWLRRPNRFRWRYDEPYEQLIVADGSNLWMHDVELDTFTVSPLDDAVASTPAMLLGGDRTVQEHFRVLDRFVEDGLTWVALAPLDERSDFRSLLIGFDGVVPAQLEFLDGLNHVTRLMLLDVEVNGRIATRTFEFSPPRGASVIGTPAD